MEIGLHYYNFNIGDYRRDTFHLTLLEHGVYRQLIDTYYLNERPLSADTAVVMRTHSARTKDEKAAVLMVLENFFFLTPEGWIHKGCEKTIEKYREKSAKARVSAESRWCKRNANASETQCESDANHKPITNNQEPIKKTSAARGTRLPQDFQLPGDWISFCAQQRPELDAREVFEGFRDYWVAQPGQKGVKTDWTATWRNWVRRQQTPKKTAADERRDQMAQLTRGLSVPKAKPFWAKDDNLEVIANVEPKGLL